ncbi:MAG TPA: hypothetical protein VMU57_18595, partial [Edaphobacter sp.]|uniref:hypothetical protein n=1 Tax=Edaphobacter sp. TaxID=1934404 RepID=UPI002C021125
MKRLNLGRFNQCGNGFIAEISMETESAELLFDLKHLKWTSSLLFGRHYKRLQRFTELPEQIKPAIAVFESQG